MISATHVNLKLNYKPTYTMTCESCNYIQYKHVYEDVLGKFTLFLSAQPCPHLNAPLNGSISCTGEQVTDESCSFLCERGFELQGSPERLCQPNNTWTGLNTYCNILHCLVLEPSEDAFIIYPCETAYTSVCSVGCNVGYHRDLELGDSLIQCVLAPNIELNEVQWTERPVCVGMFQ